MLIQKLSKSELETWLSKNNWILVSSDNNAEKLDKKYSTVDQWLSPAGTYFALKVKKSGEIRFVEETWQ